MVAGMAEAGQRRDEPLHEEDRRTFHQDTMAEPGLGGITHCRWDDCFRWTGRHLRQLDVFWSMWQCAGSFGTCGSLQEPQRGQRFASLDADLAQKGPTSPSEGPDVSLLAHNYDIFSI
jgi:hypothetical protein